MKLFLSTTNSEHEKSINLMPLETRLSLKFLFFQMEVAEDSHFFLKVHLNAWVLLALFARGRNYNGCSLVAFKHKDHDYHNLPGGKKAFWEEKKKPAQCFNSFSISCHYEKVMSAYFFSKCQPCNLCL